MVRKKTSDNKKISSADGTAGKQLVIVESPAKAKTINKYLGPDYVVMASVGHVRDLPEKNPKGVKDPVPGVDLENDFKPTYQIIKGKTKTVSELKRAAKNVSGIWLATDMDREGEAIAWHLSEALGIKVKNSNRVVFNAITKNEIEKAFRHPRMIDLNKVNAQQARRILDRIVGYQISPLLWKKVAGRLSAGRVQSVAVRVVVEREHEIEAFIPKEYWKLSAYFTPDLKNTASLAEEWQKWLSEAAIKQNGKKNSGRTIREKTGWLSDHGSFVAELTEIDRKKFAPENIESALTAAKLAGFQLDEQSETPFSKTKDALIKKIHLKGHLVEGPAWQVKSMQTKRTKSHPYAPFITSTLQQTAANQLSFTAQTTMRTAQSLYEGVVIGKTGSVGLITYMRTDSTHLSSEAVKTARQYISSEFGDQYLPAKTNYFSSSNKSAQEAHEAIRPTDVNLTPNHVKPYLNDRQFALYRLIWTRFVACQMADAQWDSTTVLISGVSGKSELIFRATGRVLIFDGQYKVVGIPNTSGEAVLPLMNEKQPLSAIQIDPVQHFTSPPPRYTEASLVKKLETEGIGRPSTYAQIIQVIQNRKYVEKTQNRFYATDLGDVVTAKLIEAFPEILQVGYTRDMEQQLDDVEEKGADWVQMLHLFYNQFKQNLDTAYEDMDHAKAETEPAPHTCPQCGSGTVYRFGRNGRFLSCSAYPKCKYASPINSSGDPVSPEEVDIACPQCNSPMLSRKGRFGLFLSCTNYPDCKGILNLDKNGFISPPKIPPLLTDLKCSKCTSPLNLRRSKRGPWLSCSKFPKCTGRMGWAKLDNTIKNKWEKALEEHEKTHPLPVILKLDGTPAGEKYKPQALSKNGDQPKE